jgi:hypothetical protein
MTSRRIPVDFGNIFMDIRQRKANLAIFKAAEGFLLEL